MPKGPQGQKRPADTVAAAIRTAKILTGEETEEFDSVKNAAAELGSRGGTARARKLTAAQRSAIAKSGANARWKKGQDMTRKKEPV